MKTKWIVILVLCAMAAAFFLGAKGVVKLNQDEAAESSGSKQDILVGLLLVPETEDYRFEQEAGNLTEDFSEGDTDPFAAFCEKSGAIRFLIYLVKDGKEDERGYWMPLHDSVFSDFDTYISGDGLSLQGTLLLTTPVDFSWFYVYQKSDGSLYTKQTMGASMGGSGGSMTVTDREDYTETVNGESKNSYRELALTMQSVHSPNAYDVLSFNEAHVLLDQRSFAPDGIPESLQFPDGTAYVLIERRGNGEDGPTVERNIYQPEDQGFHPFFDRGDGLCETQYCEFIWPK